VIPLVEIALGFQSANLPGVLKQFMGFDIVATGSPRSHSSSTRTTRRRLPTISKSAATRGRASCADGTLRNVDRARVSASAKRSVRIERAAALL
jgi:hypothetical protein